MPEIDRRQALILMGGTALGLTIPKPAFAQEIDLQTQKFILAAKKIGVPDVAGLRISNIFERNGKSFLAYSSLIFTEDDDGSIVPWNTLDNVHHLNLDYRFKNGSVGVLVPEQILPPTIDNEEEFQNRLDGLEIPPAFVEYLQNLRQVFDPGLPTSPVQYIQANGQRVLATLRLQSMAIQQWTKTGEIQPQLIGNAATQLEQLIPRKSLLTEATNDPEIVLSLSIQPIGVEGLISFLAQTVGISNNYATSIARCESHLDPSAQNRSGARGLWQIMPVHESKFTKRGWNYWTDWMDPYKNTVVAIEIMQTQGLSAWDCS